MTPQQLGWVAGVMEGEGSFMLKSNHGYIKSPVASVQMTDEDVIVALHSLTGIGRVTGPYQPKWPGSKPTWSWRVQKAQDVFDLGNAIRPLMFERRKDQFDRVVKQYKEDRFVEQNDDECGTQRLAA